jgi:hypothetical protein
MHAFNHAPAALRIFRFAVNTVPRILELAHTTAFLRECAIEFGSTDATLPVAMENDHAAGRYYTLFNWFGKNHWCCTWLSQKMLTSRVGALMPLVALMPDVTRHDVNWGEGALLHEHLQLTHNGFGLKFDEPMDPYNACFPCAKGPVGVTSGKHLFSVTIVRLGTTTSADDIRVGWVAGAREIEGDPDPTYGSGEMFMVSGLPSVNRIIRRTGLRYYLPTRSSCTIACLLDLDTGIMTVFIDGEIMETESDYRYHADCEWFPTVEMGIGYSELYSNSI